MSNVFTANIININNNESLTVEWLRKTSKDNSVYIGGPKVTTIPLSIVPFELRKINAKISVTFTDAYTATKVVAYDKNT